MNTIKGKLANYSNLLIGIFCKYNNIFIGKRIVYCKKKPLISLGIKAYIVPSGCAFKTNLPILEVDSGIPFKDGDVINISKEGIASLVWDKKSPHNALYVTDICNSKCIMCPQTERSHARYDESITILDYITLKKDECVGITGGEPTLNINKLSEILNKIQKKSKNQQVHILTNGRLFKDIDVVKKISDIKNIKISVGIPLYSDIAEEHDFIVGAEGAFSETIQGIYNLGKQGINIEIRIVILRQNYQKLKEIANFIYRNIPFVSRIALMGMEYHGDAETNYDLINVDPFDYKEDLYSAIRQYVRFNMLVDVYNIPLCLVDNKIENFCRDSISTWKKTYVSKCNECVKKDICCGVFETSFIHSNNIKPFK